MYKTRLGQLRLNHQQRVDARRILSSQPIIFTCACNQCGCGGFDTVEYQKTQYCPTCGIVKRSPLKGHITLCHKAQTPS